MNSKLVDLLKEVDSLKLRLSSLRPLPVEALKKIQDALDIEYTYESNRIEGNTLTLQETALVVNEGITISGKSMREHLEAINHAEAIGYIKEVAQQDIEINGHAIECRINAENPEKGFRPSPGTITDLHLPGGKGIRVDSAIYSGCSISPYYDSMVAKLIVWAKNRDEAIQKMQSALGEVIIEGIDTNVDYLYELLNNPVYQSGEFNVNFIDTIKH